MKYRRVLSGGMDEGLGQTNHQRYGTFVSGVEMHPAGLCGTADKAAVCIKNPIALKKIVQAMG